MLRQRISSFFQRQVSR